MSFLQMRRQRMQDDFAEQVQQALEQWKDAQNYFENVTDPDLVDYAIFGLETARRRYRYMLKNARERGAYIPYRLEDNIV